MKNRLNLKLAIVAAGLLGVAASQNAAAITLDFASITGANVSFQNGNFVFNNNGAGYSLGITGSTGVGNSVGDFGSISGVYNIGNITTLGALQTAPVTGSGTMLINDGSLNMTGTVVWDTIATYGVGTTINVLGTLNLTGITYTGTQSDLLALAAAGSGFEAITLQFASPQTLTALKAANSAVRTSFSGNITSAVPDGGLTAMLLGMGMLGLGFVRRMVQS